MHTKRQNPQQVTMMMRSSFFRLTSQLPFSESRDPSGDCLTSLWRQIWKTPY
ncbi:MAG: hypothetical protein DMF60_15345 [Acidobacteria bacterium]|nr:MAG: hypothetical protein DMF60_15345 [Acidobacteriota bacterium]